MLKNIKEIINQSETIEQLQFAEDLLKTKIRSIRELLIESVKNSVLSKIINQVLEEEGISENDVFKWGPKVQVVYNTLSEKTQKKSEDEQSLIEEMNNTIGDYQQLLGQVNKKMKDIIWADLPAPCEAEAEDM